MLIGLLAIALHAAPVFQYGPSMPVAEIRLSGQIGQFTPGLGVQGELQWNSGLALGAMLFGNTLGLGTANPGAAISIAPFVCDEVQTQSLGLVGVCVGPGIDLNGTEGGLLKDFTWKRNLFGIGSFHTHF